MASTSFAAAKMLGTEVTSIWRRATRPGRLRDWREESAEVPLEREREPRRTRLEGEERSWAASSKPMPPFALRLGQCMVANMGGV